MRRHSHSLELFFVHVPAARAFVADVTQAALRAATAFIEHEHTDDPRDTLYQVGSSVCQG